MRDGLTHQQSVETAFQQTAQCENSRAGLLKQEILRILPGRLLVAYRFFRTGDWWSALLFLLERDLDVPFAVRFQIIRRLYVISMHVPCEHLQAEIIRFIRTVLSLPRGMPGFIVECGCFKGGGTAKFSIVAKLTGRKLIVFDTFEGIPAHSENHGRNIWGGPIEFSIGDYYGSLEEVEASVRKFGEIETCEFVKGMFQDTLPLFRNTVAAAYLDVDLASSTRSCLQHLWPLLTPGGFLFSHDGHLPLVLEVITDEHFWLDQLGASMPKIHHSKEHKLIWMQKRPIANGC
ncbi:MAG TPA: TylF/MycF/NovP-related O-methyltransferase [Candidatus Acidoferrales bacterium]|nr:TylF/MycF/NovP-related O-methyltransferase [Candidatus Acidoferrales bacterium]